MYKYYKLRSIRGIIFSNVKTFSMACSPGEYNDHLSKVKCELNSSP
jgi:hypothetical protein